MACHPSSGGQSTLTRLTIRSISPQRPTEVIGEWPDVGVSGVEAAISRAGAAREGWARVTAFDRSRVLRLAADRMETDAGALADLMVREVGKPVREAVAEVARAVAILRFYAQAALDPDGETYPAADSRALLLARRRPRGIVGLITPWNFPVAIPVWKIAPALAWGNVVVHKPASNAMACALRIESYFDAPDGVFQTLVTGPNAARRLPAHADVAAISFTGSAEVGHEVVASAAAHGVAMQAEMGGSNASIILPDADVGFAAKTIAVAAMAFAGQKCTATSRVIVVGDGLAFREALAAAIRALPVGDPARSETVVGPVITESARQRVIAGARDAQAHGGSVLVGGTVGDEEGFFVPPTLVDLPDTTAELARDEFFGPICAVLRVSDIGEAVRLANGTRYGLVAAVFTNDLERVLDITSRLEAGLIRVNLATTGVDFHAPFGGEKASSHGPREQGRAAREFYTSTATITIAPQG